MRATFKRTLTVTAVTAALAASGLAVALAGPASAADGYDAKIAGQPKYTPLVNLVQSSTLPVDVVNLPAGVGLYAMHCKIPANQRSMPTLCDLSPGAAAYLPAVGEARAAASFPIRVNAEFWGANPNPTAGATAPESVDCRATTGDPRATTCAVYVLGAGREAANPSYLRVFPTVFSPVRADRSADAVTVTVGGKAMGPKAKVALVQGKPQSFVVKTTSGLTANASGDTCSIVGGKISALAASGTCTVRITTTGGKNFTPLVTTRTFTLG